MCHAISLTLPFTVFAFLLCNRELIQGQRPDLRVRRGGLLQPLHHRHCAQHHAGGGDAGTAPGVLATDPCKGAEGEDQSTAVPTGAGETAAAGEGQGQGRPAGGHSARAQASGRQGEGHLEGAGRAQGQLGDDADQLRQIP